MNQRVLNKVPGSPSLLPPALPYWSERALKSLAAPPGSSVPTSPGCSRPVGPDTEVLLMHLYFCALPSGLSRKHPWASVYKLLIESWVVKATSLRHNRENSDG